MVVECPPRLLEPDGAYPGDLAVVLGDAKIDEARLFCQRLVLLFESIAELLFGHGAVDLDGRADESFAVLNGGSAGQFGNG